PVRLDGWQQGFVVPAGPGGTVTLSFRPAAAYHLALVASMLAVAILLALTAWSFLGRRPAGVGRDAAGDGAPLPGRGRAWLGLLGVTALIFVAGGPVALAVPLLAVLAWLLPRPAGGTARHDLAAWVPWLAFGGLVASGLLSAVRPFGQGLLGPFGWPAQACALVALAAALMPAVAVPARRRPGAPDAPAPAATPEEHR
ncbi:MAG TPA: hypothetical protein VEF71_15770, partial [Streptosporangiaceae bacterium]|nr:hypothetical protein [Streptosporangiaceae bacterium]